MIDCPGVADSCKAKQGRHIPGTGQRIVPPDAIAGQQPDVCIVFPWNIFDEVTAAFPEYLEAGRFVRLLPEVQWSSADSASATSLSTSASA